MFNATAVSEVHPVSATSPPPRTRTVGLPPETLLRNEMIFVETLRRWIDSSACDGAAVNPNSHANCR